MVRAIRHVPLRATIWLATRRPLLTLVLAVALAGASFVYTARELTFEPDRNSMIREDRVWNERYLEYRESFSGTHDFLVVVTQKEASAGAGGPRASAARRFVDRLARRLERHPDVGHVFHRVDPAFWRSRSLLFLTSSELEELRRTLKEDQQALRRLAREPTLEQTLRLADRRLSSALVSTSVSGLLGSDEPRPPIELDFLTELAEGILAQLERGAGERRAFVSPWDDLFAVDEDERSGYLATGDETYYFLLVAPEGAGRSLAADRRALHAVQAEIDELLQSFPGLRAGTTGQRAINLAEMEAAAQDSRRAAALALAGVALVFIIGFTRVRNPLFAVAALVIGVAWSAGATTLLVGHLTVLSVAFTSILVGLGIDFGVHIVARYEEGRAAGGPAADAIAYGLRGSGPGIFAGALTTSAAFLAVGFSDFLGIAELGVIAGVGVLLCLLSSLLVLPALLALFPGRPSPRRSASPVRGLLRPLYRRPRWLAGGGVSLALLCLLLVPAVSYDSDLLRLHAEGVPAVEWERELVTREGESSAFAVSTARDLERAREQAAAFERLPEVARVESVADLVPPEQTERAARARSVAPLIPEVRGDGAAPRGVDLERLARLIDQLRFKLRAGSETESARRLLDRVRRRLAVLSPSERLSAHRRLEEYQRLLADDFLDKLRLLRAGADPEPVSVEDLPRGVRRRLVSGDGRLLLRIFPAEDIWSPGARQRFVSALRSVDPAATGSPVQMHEASRLMLDGYIEGGLYALVVVLALLWLDFRRLRYVALALVPFLVGAAWTLGYMALSGLAFNLANLVIVPLMIGIGIDIGLHATHRFLQDGQSGLALVAGSTGRAVVVSGLTTAIGFGALGIARHEGIQSLGLLLGVGVLANVLAALLVLAPILSLLGRSDSTLRASPASDAPTPGRSAR